MLMSPEKKSFEWKIVLKRKLPTRNSSECVGNRFSEIHPYFKNVAQKIDPFESLLIFKRKKKQILLLLATN